MRKIVYSFGLALAVAVLGVQAQAPNFGLVGFATQNGGTTGGAGGAVVTVTNYADLKRYAETKDTKYIINVSGTIKGTGSVTGGTYVGSIRVQSNKTIVGVGSTAFLDGVGFSISGAKNIIIQNIKFSLISVAKQIPAGSGDIPNIYSKLGDEGRPQLLVNSGDLISVFGTSSNIWIDHCEFYQEDPRVQTNQDLYDGLLDVKNSSGFITISWCYFHDHHKCHLIGSSDTDLFADRKITFHHNYYKTIQERVPLYRGGVAHFFNNYTFDVYSGIVNTRVNACVKVEKNYFEKSKNTVYSKNSKILGNAERVDNKEVSCTSTESYPSACTAAIPYTYSTVLTANVDNVKSVVMAYAGVGKLGTVTELNEEVDETEATSLALYPNPFEHSVLLTCKGSCVYKVRDMAGQLLESGAGQDKLELGASLPKGMYMVEISEAGKLFVRKIQKQ